MNECITTAEKIYEQAKAALGTSLVPVGDDPDVGCAISATVLLKERCGMDIKETLSTLEFLHEIEASPLFQEVFDFGEMGDIWIDATGTSIIPNTPITHGHCGVLGKFGIMSNSSLTGLWSEFYDKDSWKQRYEIQGGYPTRKFRAV